MMGNNHKFRLSDMIPYAWFHKLKEIGTKTTRKNHPSKQKNSPPSPPLVAPISIPTSSHHQSDSSDHYSLSHPGKSYHLSRQLTRKNKNTKSPVLLSNHLSLDPPRKSTRRRRPANHKKRASTTTSSSSTTTTTSTNTRCYYSSSSVSAGWSCGATASLHSFLPKPEARSKCNSTPLNSSPDRLCLLPEFSSPDHALPHSQKPSSFDRVAAWSSSPSDCRLDDGPNDILIDVDKKSLRGKKSGDGLGGLGSALPPIKTEHRKLNETLGVIRNNEKVKTGESYAKYTERNADASNLSVKVVVKGEREESVGSSPAITRRFFSGSSGIRLRINSPRIARKTLGTSGRRSVSSSSRGSISSESLAIVKSSFDPQRDFRESMVEMIVENNIKASKDLEELLACYLSLNADEYHAVIIKVFKQIWFDLSNTRRRRGLVA